MRACTTPITAWLGLSGEKGLQSKCSPVYMEVQGLSEHCVQGKAGTVEKVSWGVM